METDEIGDDIGDIHMLLVDEYKEYAVADVKKADHAHFYSLLLQSVYGGEQALTTIGK